MRLLKTLMLSAITAVTGVFIACAYGMKYMWQGFVRDAQTESPIPGIEVTCIIDGTTALRTTTRDEGVFNLDSKEACDSFVFTDVDGDANGSYQTTTLTALSESEDNIVKMEPTL